MLSEQSHGTVMNAFVGIILYNSGLCGRRIGFICTVGPIFTRFGLHVGDVFRRGSCAELNVTHRNTASY